MGRPVTERFGFPVGALVEVRAYNTPKRMLLGTRVGRVIGFSKTHLRIQFLDASGNGLTDFYGQPLWEHIKPEACSILMKETC